MDEAGPQGTKHMDENCWCNPELIFEDPETGNQVWLHKRPN